MDALSVSDGMELMQMMPHIEALRAKNDFVYMMLYSSERIPEREYYIEHIMARVLAFLGIAPDAPHNSVAMCVRTYVGALPELDEDACAPENTLANVEREYICNTWITACTAINTSAKVVSAEFAVIRKNVHDTLLFLALSYYPDFLKWLRNCNPVEYHDDVFVLNPNALLIFADRVVRPSIESFLNCTVSFSDMVAHLTGSYVITVGVYEPSEDAEHTEKSDFMPDIPDDYQMCPQ